MQETEDTPGYGIQGQEGRKAVVTRKERLSTYRETIHQFLPFVLVRCSKYTNSRHLADIIATYVFICAYRLSEILDGANKMSILIDNMVSIIGEEFSQRKGTGVNGKLLFKLEDDLHFAKVLAEMGTDECLEEIRRHPDLIARNIDLDQFEKITVSVMEHLLEQDILQKIG